MLLVLKENTSWEPQRCSLCDHPPPPSPISHDHRYPALQMLGSLLETAECFHIHRAYAYPVIYFIFNVSYFWQILYCVKSIQHWWNSPSPLALMSVSNHCSISGLTFLAFTYEGTCGTCLLCVTYFVQHTALQVLQQMARFILLRGRIFLSMYLAFFFLLFIHMLIMSLLLLIVLFKKKTHRYIFWYLICFAYTVYIHTQKEFCVVF